MFKRWLCLALVLVMGMGAFSLAEEIALVSATAQSASDCDTSLGSSVCSYIESGMTLPYVMNGCPDLWAENDLGTYLMKNYLSQKKWRDDTYEDIANFCVSSWARMGLFMLT